MSNQVEIDIERHVLSQRKKLTDNTFEKIFTRNDRNESGMFTYNCHLCAVPNLTGERALQTHITGKKHQQRLMVEYVPNAAQFRTPLVQKPKPLATVFPGEPAPPGYEDEVNMIPHLEIIARGQNKPLIGLEYVVELIDNKAKEPFYVCTLCDKRCDPRNIMPQITSHRHRMRYLETHFNSIMKVLSLNKSFNVDMKFRERILSSIADKIEKKFKRAKPHICEYRDYERNKSGINAEIKNKKHFSESDWADCNNFLLEDIKNTADHELETVSSESDNEYDDVQQGVLNVSRNVTYPISPSRNRKILSPRELSEQSNAKMQEKYILEKFKASVEIAVKAEEKKYKEFVKSPEKHPLYSEEWKAFWSRRYKELVAQGKDALGHDYKPEWIEFWTLRMKDLHKTNIEKIKSNFRKKLGLSVETVMRIENSPSDNRGQQSRSRSPRSIRSRKRSDSPIKISDDSDDEQYRRSNQNRAKRYRMETIRKSEERSQSRFSESPHSRHSDYRPKMVYESNFYQSRSRDFERSGRSKSPDIIDDGPVNVISVCRLLSALETELGLMAKSVLDLLTKAVAIEKMKPNSADELLYNNDNCTILETVKEKLKGILTANLLQSNKRVAVKRAIQNIATLLHEVSKKKPSTSSRVERAQETLDDNVDPVALAKLEIAKVITASLLEQGRSDVSPEELEALVESFMESAANAEDEEVEPEEKEVIEKPEPRPSTSSVQIKKKIEKDSSSNGLENLTDEDLQTLLKNFADLTSDEQSHLIAYLSKIEQTNPTRVEKLRKYVNIEDNEVDFDDGKEDMNIDMDIAAGVNNPSPQMAFLKTSQTIQQELSDDDYDDDAMAKKLGMNGSHSGASSKTKPFSNVAGPSNTLKDNMGLADSLMSSLMQSSKPNHVNGASSSRINDNMHSSYYHHQMPQYSNMMPSYDQQMNMSMGMNVNSQMFDHQMHNDTIGTWSQNAASNFFKKEEIPPEYINQNNQDKMPYRKRFENVNNRQLTGKGKKK